MNTQVSTNKTNIYAGIILFTSVVLSYCFTTVGLSDRFPALVAAFWIAVVIVILSLQMKTCLLSSGEVMAISASIIIKMVIIGYTCYNMDLQNPTLSLDAGGFWRVASAYYDGDYSIVYTPYPYIINALFHVFGKNYMLVLLTNAFLTTQVTFLLLHFSRELLVSSAMRKSIVELSCLTPYLFIYSSMLWRESIYIYLITCSFLSMTKYIKYRYKSSFYLSILLLFPCIWMHIGFSPILLVYFLYSFLTKEERNLKSYVTLIFELAIGVIAVYLIFNMNSVVYLGGNEQGLTGSGLTNKLYSLGVSDNSGSSYLVGVKADSLLSVIIYTPLKVLYYYFSPLPMNWRGLLDIVSFMLDSMPHMLVALFIFKSFKFCKDVVDKRIVIVGVFSILLCGLLFAWGTSYAGTAIRHRDVFWGLEWMIVLLVWRNRKQYE